jgi:hypothetical protein
MARSRKAVSPNRKKGLNHAIKPMAGRLAITAGTFGSKKRK